MLSIKILDVKSFMNHLLLSDTFDSFLLCESTIKTGFSYFIDGKLNADFYNSDELEIMQGRLYGYWRDLKPMALSMIKGKKSPLAFKIIFILSPKNVEQLIAQNNLPYTSSSISGLYLNIHYDSGQLTCTSGSTLKIFTLDKTLDIVWEDMIRKFLASKEIPFEAV